MPTTDATPPDSNARRRRAARDIATIIKRHYDRFNRNSQRVRVLIASAEAMTAATPESKPHAEDLLRAATVFLHATVEELLRGLAQVHLPSSEGALDRIPLAGSKDTLRPEKFLLGALARHRGKTVDEVIMQSVRDHIARRTFSNVGEIAALFEQIGLRLPGNTEELMRKIAALIARRHEIVHRADIIDGEQSPTSLESKTVEVWRKAVESFVAKIIASDLKQSFPGLRLTTLTEGRPQEEN